MTNEANHEELKARVDFVSQENVLHRNRLAALKLGVDRRASKGTVSRAVDSRIVYLVEACDAVALLPNPVEGVRQTGTMNIVPRACTASETRASNVSELNAPRGPYSPGKPASCIGTASRATM